VRNSRLQTQIDAWAVQLPLLVDAYLEYRYEGPAPVDENTSWVLEIISLSGKSFFSLIEIFINLLLWYREGPQDIFPSPRDFACERGLDQARLYWRIT
jgi:hypothetical protein